MTDADLKFYVGSTEYGTPGNPLSFSRVMAGTTVPHPLNPVYLWNDKGGIIDSVPAKNIVISVLEMEIADEVLGVSTGAPSQTFVLSMVPVVDGSLVIVIDSTEWTQVGTFSGVAPDAKVFTVDIATGIVTFGDGVNGVIPESGKTVYGTYMPNLLQFGSEVVNSWLQVKSLGVTANPVVVNDEQVTSTDATHVQMANGNLLSVQGIWLLSDPTHSGTNYFTGGSFDAVSGIVTLGTPLPSTNTDTLNHYTFGISDDLEPVFYSISNDTTHSFVNPIPKNNAKLLYFNLVVPENATPSGGGNVNFRIRFQYQQ